MKKKKIRPHRPSPATPKEFKYLDGVIYALDYAKNPQIKAAIEQFKYKFNQDLAEYFGDLLAEKIGELSMTKRNTLHLIPVPLHRKRLNYRGFNQAEVIAEALLKRMGEAKIQVTDLLRRIKNTQQQAKLSKRERQANLRNAFCMNKNFVQADGLSGGLYCLVDDVCTTGATLEQSAKTLKENGLGKVYGLVVARVFK